MQKEIEDKTSAEYQRQTWEAWLTEIFFHISSAIRLKLAEHLLKSFLDNLLVQALRKSINGLVNKVNAPWHDSLTAQFHFMAPCDLPKVGNIKNIVEDSRSGAPSQCHPGSCPGLF